MWKVPDVKLLCMPQILGALQKQRERLNYTPSGVSQLVGALENETGLTLLRRTRKGVTLTPDGEIFACSQRIS